MGVRVNRLALTAFATIVMVSGVALADERPQIAAVGDTSVAAGPVYLRAGISFQSIDLPSVDLGNKRLGLIGPGGGLGNTNNGPIATFKPTATGAGVDGGIGYFLPAGFVPPGLGARPRIEVNASYLKANVTQSSTTTLFPDQWSFQRVDGSLIFFAFCTAAAPCPTTTSLRSQYEAWHAGAKAASDFAMGPLTLTPSVGVFGGEARNGQELNQAIPAATITRTLFETASENATDRVGSRVGLNGKYDVMPWLALGLGGNVGLAYRHIGLHAFDIQTGAGGTGHFSAGRNVLAFLAGAEASVVARVDPAIAFKLFGGVTYDNDVPGIVAQNYTGSLGFGTNPVTPVGIKTAGEIGYYAGVAVMMRFGQ